jgi:hypothetical protein
VAMWILAVLFWTLVLIDVVALECPLHSLQQFESSVYSQNGEDGIILALLSIIGSVNRYE